MVQLARKVLKNSFFNSARAFISGIGGFAFSVVLARFLTPELFGIYALAITLCLFTLQFDLGTGYTAIRYVSYALGRKNENLARGYFRFLLQARLILGVALSFLLAILAKPLAFRIFNKPELFIPLEVLSVFILFFFLTDFLDCCFQALQDFKYPTVRHAIYESLKFGLVVPFVIIGFFHGIFIGITVATFATFAVMFLILRRKYAVLFQGGREEIEKGGILKFMGFVSIGSFSAVIFSYVDMIMLGIFLPTEYVGYYKAATNIIFGIAGLMGIAGVLFPVFTQLEGKSLEDAFKKVFRYTLIFSSPFAISIAYFSPQIVRIIYGVEYLQASIPLLILSPLIVFVATDFYGVLFGAKERPEYGTAVSIASMTMNILLNYILILKFGIAGAAIATTTSRFFNTLASGIIAWKKIGICPQAISIYKPAFASILMFLFLYIIPHPQTLFIGISELFSAIALYFAVMFAIKGIEIDDFRYAKAIFGVESFAPFLGKSK